MASGGGETPASGLLSIHRPFTHQALMVAVFLMLMRQVTGHDGIEMQRTDSIDRDGKACRPGRYQLTSKGRKLALKAISMTEVA